MVPRSSSVASCLSVKNIPFSAAHLQPFTCAAERGALAISKGGEICSFAAHKLLFSFKGKSATAPLSLALSQGGVNFTYFGCRQIQHLFSPREGVFLIVMFIICMTHVKAANLDVWPRKTMSFQGSHPTGLPPITLPSVIYSRHIKWLPNQPHSSSNYALTDGVAQ